MVESGCMWRTSPQILNAYRGICGITGSVSTIGSSLIIFMIFRGRAKLTRVQNRLLVPMCIFDILGSIAQALSTLPMDSTEQISIDCPYYNERIVLGNHASCTAQGIFYQLGMIVPGYNAALCVYYAMVIKWKKTDEETERVEPYLHALVLAPTFILAATALSNDLYGNLGVICFLTNKHDDEGSPDRIYEKKQTLIIVITVIGSLIAVIIMTIIIYCMVAVYSTVKQQEERMSVYRFERPGTPRKKSKLASKTEDTKIQAYLYVLGYFVTCIFPTISFVIYQIFNVSVPIALMVLQSIFGPLKGFWNFLIFIRPRFNLVTKDHPEKSFWRRLLMTVLAKGGESGNSCNRAKGTKMNSTKPLLLSRYHNCKNPRSTLRSIEEGTNAHSIQSPPKSSFHESFSKKRIRDFPLDLECEPISRIEESKSYCSDTSHPVSPPIDSSDTTSSISKVIGDEGDGQNDIFGPLSLLVAQDLLGSNILLPSVRRTSMIDFRLTALDRDDLWNKESKFLNLGYNEEDDDRNSSMLDSLPGMNKLTGGSSQEQRRKSCPSLSFTWKEDVETKTVRRAFGELDDILVGTSTSQSDFSYDASKSSIEGNGADNACNP